MQKEEIVNILKSEGLDVAEDLALVAIKASISLLKEVVPKVSKGFGGALIYFLSTYEDQIYELIDAIDGKKDGDYK